MTEALKNTGIAVVNEPVVKTGHKSIVVLGLAESGTSAIAGMLHALGIYMGEVSQAPNTFEDQELIALMEKKGDRKALKTMLRERTAKHSVWGFNRPGSLRYLPRFSNLFPDPHYIAVFRDHASLGLTKMEPGKSDFLSAFRKAHRQLKKMVDFLLEGPRPIMLVSYEKMLQSPEHLVDRTIEFLGVEPTEEQYENALAAFFEQPEPIYLELKVEGDWGALEPLEDGYVKGWAQKRGSLEPLELEILVNGVVAQKVIANQMRKGLAQKGIGNGKHAFSIPISDLKIQEDKAEIGVRTVDAKTNLNNSPRLWEKP